jgi:uncharacterized protein YdaU (DUF1376 family)
VNFYSHHIGDFIRDTSRLNDSQCMAYLRMLWIYYESEEPLADDVPALAFRIGASDQDVKQILSHFFFMHEGRWHQSRCDEEILRFREKSSKAKVSAEKRWKNANAMRTHSERNANESISDANEPFFDANQEPITNNQEPINIPPLPPANAVGGEQVKKRKPKKPKIEPTEFEQFVMDEYNRTLGETNGFVTAISDGRAKAIRKVSEIRPNAKNQEWWTKYFEHVSQSQFLTGRATDFSAPFDWMLKPDNVIKIIEGQYHK